MDHRSDAGVLLLAALIAGAVIGAVTYLLAAPHIDRATVNNVAYICAGGPVLIGLVLAVFAGVAWLDARRHARRREDEADRNGVLYREQQAARQQSTDLAVLRQMTGVVEAGARAQLTAARAQHELARTAALQPLDDGSAWAIPAEWAEIMD